MQPIFITGIGTDVGKTVVSAIVTQALKANYWKPIQAGFETGTDAQSVQHLTQLPINNFHKEVYKLAMPASPHIAARVEQKHIQISEIMNVYQSLPHPLVIEGAGGLLVPLNENEFVIDIIKQLQAKVILVSRNYLGSINHSLLTAAVCKQHNIDVLGWIFNDQYLNYEAEIEAWSGFRKIASIPFTNTLDSNFILQQANEISPVLQQYL
ncbi:MAG: dethiobiotin synthase [Chitinophagaceae bacterium]